jgi:Tol biopolymer transport system component
MIGASLATIQSTVEFVPRFVTGAHGEVAFRWGSGRAGSVEGEGLIVFLGTDGFGAATDLRVVEPDGSGLRVLQLDDERPDEFIPLRGRGDCPELSPDGRFLAFGRTTTRSPVGDQELAVLDLSSGEIVGHAGSFGGSFDWSPDGSGIVFDRVVVWTSDGTTPTDPDGLWFFDVPGGSTTMLVPPVAGRSLLHPRWSPEGDWIAFHELAWSPAGSDFFEAAWEDTGRFGVSRAEGVGFLILDELIREFDWSPAGDEIVFGNTVMINPGSQLMVARLDTGSVRSLFEDPSVSPYLPRWSPDGARIAFIGATIDGGGAWTLDLDDRSALQVTASDIGSVYGVAWAPEGDRLVVSSQSGLYVVSLVGGETTYLGQGACPTWGAEAR